MNIPLDVMKLVYARGYEESFAAYPLGDRGVWITGGVRAVAEWARREALLEAANDPALRLSGHSGISVRGLRTLAEEDTEYDKELAEWHNHIEGLNGSYE